MSCELEERCPPSCVVAAGGLRSAFTVHPQCRGFRGSKESPDGFLPYQQISGSQVLLKFASLASFSGSVVHLAWGKSGLTPKFNRPACCF